MRRSFFKTSTLIIHIKLLYEYRGYSTQPLLKIVNTSLLALHLRAALPTVWGDVSEADRGYRLRQRNPFSKGFPSIYTCKTSVRLPRSQSGAILLHFVMFTEILSHALASRYGQEHCQCTAESDNVEYHNLYHTAAVLRYHGKSGEDLQYSHN